MRIVFAGTPNFAVKALSHLHNSNHEIIAVYCQPDRPKGRGKVLTPCPVKLYSLESNLEVIQPENFSNEQNLKKLTSLKPDLIVVAAYGQILSKDVLELPKLGCLNIHASLLPRWRGAAPIERSIQSGDQETGISIMQMNEGLDTGDVLLTRKQSISKFETSGSLTASLSMMGAELIVEAIDCLSELDAKIQEHSKATYAKKILKAEAQIEWNQSAENINQMIRAFNPRPIAQSNAEANEFKEKVLRIIEAEVIPIETSKPPGTVIEQNKEVCHIATGVGILCLKRVQLAGKNVVSIKDFNNAYQLIKLK
ncbi:methionyl-tRNA formyltransferase [Candidatus Pseudothioglobus singularis]|nr:methionyl-tRNA formyltransferase [Candidatus Pseudothioglobus singularis]